VKPLGTAAWEIGDAGTPRSPVGEASAHRAWNPRSDRRGSQPIHRYSGIFCRAGTFKEHIQVDETPMVMFFPFNHKFWRTPSKSSGLKNTHEAGGNVVTANLKPENVMFDA
jgi:hypothetical protein